MVAVEVIGKWKNVDRYKFEEYVLTIALSIYKKSLYTMMVGFSLIK